MKEYRVSASRNIPGQRLQRSEWRTYQWGEEDVMEAEMREYVRTEFLTSNFEVHCFEVAENHYDIPVLIFVKDERFGVFSPFAIEVAINGVLQ